MIRITLTDKKFKVHHGKYLLVKNLTESAKDGSIITTVIGDQNNIGMKIALCGLQVESIPIGEYMIIKEPFFKEANDGLPEIRVESPKDVIF